MCLCEIQSCVLLINILILIVFRGQRQLLLSVVDLLSEQVENVNESPWLFLNGEVSMYLQAAVKKTQNKLSAVHVVVQLSPSPLGLFVFSLGPEQALPSPAS